MQAQPIYDYILADPEPNSVKQRVSDLLDCLCDFEDDYDPDEYPVDYEVE